MGERITTAGIYIKDNKVLVAKRREGGAISGKWEFPGGKNRWGESVEETLKREYMEELGIEIEVYEEILSFDFENKDMVYHLKARRIDLLSLDFSLNFHTEVLMADQQILKTLDFSESDQKIACYLVENKFL